MKKRRKYAEGGSVKDYKNPILQPREYVGGFETPAQTYADARHRTRDLSKEESKSIARDVALDRAKAHRVPTNDEEGYKGYKRGGVVRKK